MSRTNFIPSEIIEAILLWLPPQSLCRFLKPEYYVLYIPKTLSRRLGFRIEQVSNRYIPLEIIEDILLRLPPQSLCCFKSVSKTWNSLISHPRFIKDHLHQTEKKLLAFCNTNISLYLIELTLNPHLNSSDDVISATGKKLTFSSHPTCWREIVGSCNGLVLARDIYKAMFLMNPTTLDLWKLPVNPFVYDIDVRYGFGYDSSTDDYKVVCFYYGVSIYSLRNNSWRELPDNPHNNYDGHINYNDSFSLVNGKCHWPTNDSQSIIGFSFVDDLFSEIKLPDSISNNNLWYIIITVEIGGRLGVYLRLRSGDYELWVMQEYGDSKSWTRVFSHKDYMRPVCLLQGSDRDIVFQLIDRVVVSNMDQGRCRKARIVGDPCRFIIQGSFVESIESIKRIIKTP